MFAELINFRPQHFNFCLKRLLLYSVPASRQVKFTALDDDGVEALLVVSGDHRKRPLFPADVVEEARDAGLGLDAGGFVAKASLLPTYGRAS